MLCTSGHVLPGGGVTRPRSVRLHQPGRVSCPTPGRRGNHTCGCRQCEFGYHCGDHASGCHSACTGAPARKAARR